MHPQTKPTSRPTATTLVLGSTGKTGRRIVSGLEAKGVPTRRGSRAAKPPFDWHDPKTWDDVLEDAEAVYVNYAPDLAMPGASDAIGALMERADRHGVRRTVLLSGRGEVEAQQCEQIVRDSGLDWTIVRASWFAQNFSEGAFLPMVQAGRITLPAGEIPEPFVDADDIAAVAIAALTETGHTGETYEVTGPKALSFSEVAAEISNATGRTIEFVSVPHEAFLQEVRASGAPRDVVWMLDYLFATVLDGRNVATTDGVRRALGREPKSFAQYAEDVAATGVWEGVAAR